MEFIIVSPCLGWLGFGVDPGSDQNSMYNLDILIFIAVDKSLNDMYALDHGKVYRDTSIGGSYDLRNISIVYEDDIFYISWRKKIDTGDPRDNPFLLGVRKLVWTIQRTVDAKPTSMPNDRGTVLIDFYTGNQTESNSNSGVSDLQTIVSANLKYIHGGFMAVTWGMVNVSGVSMYFIFILFIIVNFYDFEFLCFCICMIVFFFCFKKNIFLLVIARYFRHKKWWFGVHRIVQTIGTTGTFSMVT